MSDLLLLIAAIGLLCGVLAIGGAIADRFEPPKPGSRRDVRQRNPQARRVR